MKLRIMFEKNLPQIQWNVCLFFVYPSAKLLDFVRFFLFSHIVISDILVVRLRNEIKQSLGKIFIIQALLGMGLFTLRRLHCHYHMLGTPSNVWPKSHVQTIYILLCWSRSYVTTWSTMDTCVQWCVRIWAAAAVGNTDVWCELSPKKSDVSCYQNIRINCDVTKLI